MIYVEYRKTGIGAGIISGGKVMHAATHAAGELGHTHMRKAPRASVEASAACKRSREPPPFKREFGKPLLMAAALKVLALSEGNPANVTGWMILSAANASDKACAAIVEQATNYLGLGLANLVNLFNPSVLVLDQRLQLRGKGCGTR